MDNLKTNFGKRKVTQKQKTSLVQSTFSNIAKNYDLMNDIMSLGTHRLWKKTLVSWINPRSQNKILDVAAGTGDIAKICSKYTNNKCKITCVEPNQKMLGVGRKKLFNLWNIHPLVEFRQQNILTKF